MRILAIAHCVGPLASDSGELVFQTLHQRSAPFRCNRILGSAPREPCISATLA